MELRHETVLVLALEQNSADDPKRTPNEQKVGDYYFACMPTAGGPAPVACRMLCASGSSSSRAAPTPASTTTISARSWSSVKAFRSVAKPCADCCASTGSARRENAVLPLIASAAHVPLGSANSCNLTAAHTTGSKAVVRGSPLPVCRTTPPAKSWPLGSSPRKPHSAISACFAHSCAASACPWLFMAITVASSSATTTVGQWKSNSPENVSPPSSAAPWNNSASPSSPPTARRPKAASRGSGACCKIASPANCGWLKLPTSTPPTPCCARSSPTTTAVLPGCLAKTPPPGAPLLNVSNGSAASSTNAPSATTTSCSGQAAASRSPTSRAASASPSPKCTFTTLSLAGYRSPPTPPASNTRPSQAGDIFTLPLG